MADEEEIQLTAEEQLAALQAQIAEKDAELEKLKTKDTNFRKFEQRTEAEKAEILAQSSEREKLLFGEVESLRAERQREQTAKLEKAIEKKLDQLAGDDKDLRQSLLEQSKEFAGEPVDVEDVEKRLDKSFVLLKGMQPPSSPLNRPNLSSGYSGPRKEKKFTDTEEGKNTFKALFGTLPPSATK